MTTNVWIMTGSNQPTQNYIVQRNNHNLVSKNVPHAHAKSIIVVTKKRTSVSHAQMVGWEWNAQHQSQSTHQVVVMMMMVMMVMTGMAVVTHQVSIQHHHLQTPFSSQSLSWFQSLGSSPHNQTLDQSETTVLLTSILSIGPTPAIAPFITHPQYRHNFQSPHRISNTNTSLNHYRWYNINPHQHLLNFNPFNQSLSSISNLLATIGQNFIPCNSIPHNLPVLIPSYHIPTVLIAVLQYTPQYHHMQTG